MNILIDGLPLSCLYGTGLYTYTYELIHNLIKVYPQPHYELLCSNPPNSYFNIRPNKLSFIDLSLNRSVNNLSLLEKYISDKHIDIYHSPNNGFSIPIHKRSYCVMTVHDLIPISHSYFADQKYRDKFTSIFPGALKNCDRIIAVSQYIKDTLLNNFDIPESKIDVIYPGCPDMFYPMDREMSKAIVKNRYGIKGDYILYAGSIHIRKNIPRLLQAFKYVIKDTPDIKLIIAGKVDGKREAYYLNLKSMIEELLLTPYVIFTGTIEYTDMPYLYNSALCSVNLSSCEGFPMSTIESMACGTPAICSRIPVFKETAGDGAAYVNPGDYRNIGDMIADILYSKKYRSDLINRGRNQAHIYSWEESIKKIINIYEVCDWHARSL